MDATVAQATELGATVYVPAQDIPGSGRFCVLGDPEGAVFAVYGSSEEIAGSDDQPAVGLFSWHELVADSYASAFTFYSTLFGWVKGPIHDMGGAMGNYQTFSRREGTQPVGGLFNKPVEIPSAWILYLRVEDVSTTVGRVVELGGKLMNGPMEVPGGDMVAQCMDPQGAVFALHSTAA